MPRCRVCNQDNPADALFCARCTSPVAVVALHELTESDRRRCLQALYGIDPVLPQIHRSEDRNMRISLLSPAVGSDNMGDQIIELAIRRFFPSTVQFERVSIRRSLSDADFELLNDSAAARTVTWHTDGSGLLLCSSVRRA